MSQALKAGVIGLGLLGGQHAEFLHAHPAVDVVAVADIRRPAADAVAAKIGATAYEDYAEMLRRQTLDLVVVATPDSLHREPTLAAIQAGVPNILQEKPLATNNADAEAIYEAVERAGTRFFIDFANRAA